MAGTLYAAHPGDWVYSLEEKVAAAGGTVASWKRGAMQRRTDFRWNKPMDECREDEEFALKLTSSCAECW